jgi:acyl-CoA dehydrogenase
VLLDDHHEAFRDSVARVERDHVAPIAEEVDSTDRFPSELIEIFGKETR